MTRKPIVAGIGELLWDVLPTGKQMGGAPANFAFHAKQAGCESLIISAVGNDIEGEELLQLLKTQSSETRLIQKNNFPTGMVTVSVNSHGQPQYNIHEGVAWDHIDFDTQTKTAIYLVDAVCFGSLAQRNPVSAAAIQQLLALVKPDCLKVFDINLRQQYYSKPIIETSLQFADVLKLNDEELPVLAVFFDLDGNIENQLYQLMIRFQLKFLVYTMGARGSIVFSETESSIMDAPKIKVTDTVGAGDSFTAVFTSGILLGFPLAEVHRKAGEVASFVCTQKGACPILPFKVF